MLHLWPYTIHDLRGLGAKKFYGKFCAGAIDHISEYLKLNRPLLFFDLLSQIINSKLKVLYAAKNVDIKVLYIHNITKSFKESGEISVHKGTGCL